ncbi:hypothetical protein TNCV_1862801 [Trichonephila clavipes]|nr:hypothetical protein TNCV_1862801 [Trichonephila clavipes]
MLYRIYVWASRWPIYDRNVRRECLSKQTASSQPGLVRDTVVLLENSITVWIIEQHERMKVITHQIYVLNCIERDWYTQQGSQTGHQKTLHAMIEPSWPCTVPTRHAGSMAS